MGLIFAWLLAIASATDTVICSLDSGEYLCLEYDGGDYLEYEYEAHRPLEGVIGLHEFDGHDLANPYPELSPETVYLPQYSPWVSPEQIPSVFLDPKWSEPGEWTMPDYIQ